MRYSKIAIGTLVILGIGALLDIVLSLAVWEINEITDVPLWAGLLGFGFLYICALPGLLLPYCLFARTIGRLRSSGLLPATIVGTFYPLSLILLTYIAGLLMGQDAAVWDKLVESVLGWLILLLITLGPGVCLSYISVQIDNVGLKYQNNPT